MRMRMAIGLLALLSGGISGTVQAADPSPEPPADITCRLESGTATLSAEGGPQGTLLKLATPSYSGSAKFTFNGGSTPARVKFHFANARLMQRFTLSDCKHTYQGSHLGGRSVYSWDKSGRSINNQALAAVTMVLEATAKGDIEVTVSTARGTELGKDLSVSWTQYFERMRKNRLIKE